MIINEYDKISYNDGVIGTLSLGAIFWSMDICLYGNYKSIQKVTECLKQMFIRIIKNRQFYYLYHFFIMLCFLSSVYSWDGEFLKSDF